MSRLLAAISLAAIALVPTIAHADGISYDRECGGVLDTECHGTTCPTDCFTRDCLVWINVFHDAMTAQCIR
jgi:hypothetical protein